MHQINQEETKEQSELWIDRCSLTKLNKIKLLESHEIFLMYHVNIFAA